LIFSSFFTLGNDKIILLAGVVAFDLQSIVLSKMACNVAKGIRCRDGDSA